MKKRKLKIILLIFIGLLFTNVNASTNLPYNGTAHNINYTIEGFEIQIYDQESLKKDILSKPDPIKKVDIPATEITINPTEELITSTEQTKAYPNIFGVKLNINNGQELFEKKIKEQVDSLTNNDQLFCILNIRFKLTSVPENYKYIYHLGLDNIDQLLSIFSTNTLPSYSLNTTISQSINSIIYTKSTDSFDYNSKLTYKNENGWTTTLSANGLASALYEYCLLSEEKYTISDEIGPKYNNFIFHDMDDIKNAIIESQKELNNNEDSLWIVNKDNNNQNTDQSQTVKAPDTKANIINKVIIGISILLLGCIIIFTVLRKKIIKIKSND